MVQAEERTVVLWQYDPETGRLSRRFVRKKPCVISCMPSCGDCPYGRYSPCIGFCMRKILGREEAAAEG